ncbi:MAG: sugar ABC transporter permease [Congregibacter sp.]|nr:sugar ABC transporter permease [Congregibacter sp.]
MSAFKPRNNRAWLGVMPVLLIVAFSGVIPLMTVVNYSVQDILDFNSRFFVGFDWYRQTLNDPRFTDAFVRQLAFSLTILIIEVPLGVAVAKGIPRDSRFSPLILIVLALPLLIPWNVVGTIWQVYARPDIGLLGWSINALGISYNYTSEPLHAWLTLVAMDVWHWTSLIALLSFAGLTSIPKPFYQAAQLDGASRWQVFRYVELPRLRGVLIIGVLLRLMDSFMIYTEPFVLTGGGPGNATTLLSQHLATMAVGQFDLGPAAAFSVIYFLFILLFCWVFYTSVVRSDHE